MLALVFVPLQEEGFSIPAIGFHFNMYTAPAYFGMLLEIVNIIFLVTPFKDYKVDLMPNERETEDEATRDCECVLITVT